jgi:hypothetical protein
MNTSFELGPMYMTPGVMEWIEDDRTYRLLQVHTALQRYTEEDWGNLDDHDQRANKMALRNGLRIMGVYDIGGPEDLWIMTNGDRSGTTILFPSEY